MTTRINWRHIYQVALQNKTTYTVSFIIITGQRTLVGLHCSLHCVRHSTPPLGATTTLFAVLLAWFRLLGILNNTAIIVNKWLQWLVQCLHSASSIDFIVPRTRTELGDRAFSVPGQGQINHSGGPITKQGGGSSPPLPFLLLSLPLEVRPLNPAMVSGGAL